MDIMENNLNKHHDLKVGMTGFYDGIHCRVTDLIDELTIEVKGNFGKHFYWTFSFKSWINKLFDIREWKLEEEQYEKSLKISYHSLKTIVHVYHDRHKKVFTVLMKDTPLDEHCDKLLYVLEGINWADCMRQHHDLMGWEPWKPIGGTCYNESPR